MAQSTFHIKKLSLGVYISGTFASFENANCTHIVEHVILHTYL